MAAQPDHAFDISAHVAGRPCAVAVPPARLAAEARARSIGIRLPRYFAPAEIAALESATIDEATSHQRRLLSPADAANDFVGWLRATGRTGNYSNEALDAIYDIHCRQTKRNPCPVNQLRKHMRGIGIYRSRPNSKKNGSRSRAVKWTIAETVAQRVAA